MGQGHGISNLGTRHGSPTAIPSIPSVYVPYRTSSSRTDSHGDGNPDSLKASPEAGAELYNTNVAWISQINSPWYVYTSQGRELNVSTE